MPERLSSGESWIPPNIHEILDHGLIPAGEFDPELAGGDTEKFYVQDFPGLLVRLNRGEPLEDVEAAISAAQDLNGINVLPAKVVEHDSEAYVITKKVTGLDLLEALGGDAKDQVVAQADVTWANLAASIVRKRQSGLDMPRDVESPFQYMYGTIDNETQPKVLLVDLPHWTGTDYHFALLQVANGIVQLEQAGGVQLGQSRQALQEAIEAMPSAEPADGALLRAAGQAISQGIMLHVDDEGLVHPVGGDS